MKNITTFSFLILLFSGFWAKSQTLDDLTKKKMILRNGEADLVIRVGDVDNFNQDFSNGFNVFAGKPAQAHSGNIKILKDDPAGTDRIMVVTGYLGKRAGDNYAKKTYRPDNLPQSVSMDYDLKGISVEIAIIQLFIDDLQPQTSLSELQVKLNGKRVAEWEIAFNQLNQTKGIGKLITLQVPKEFLETIKSGKISLLIDDPKTGIGEGFAIDFVRLLINPKIFYHTGIITGNITDKNTGNPLAGVKISASGVSETYTDKRGNYQLSGVLAGFTLITYSLSDYNIAFQTSDLAAGEQKKLNLNLERQQVSGNK